MTLVMRQKRSVQMGGDPIESDRLRPLFMRWVGRRYNATALREAGIPLAHGSAWLSGDTILRDDLQQRVRALLDREGIAGSPCG